MIFSYFLVLILIMMGVAAPPVLGVRLIPTNTSFMGCNVTPAHELDPDYAVRREESAQPSGPSGCAAHLHVTIYY